MIVKIAEMNNQKPTIAITLRYPACHHMGTFNAFEAQDIHTSVPLEDQSTSQLHILGQRYCPNTECKAHIFFVYNSGIRKLVVTYPAEHIDFDATNLPTSVLNALEEAITCHANSCFVAAAIMVRKTLEELCRNRGAAGDNLKQRIRSLGSTVILPPELLDGLDDLRLLGNDAAHIESQNYNNIGREEVDLAIEITKEVLKGVYQYAALIDRLKAWKKP